MGNVKRLVALMLTAAMSLTPAGTAFVPPYR